MASGLKKELHQRKPFRSTEQEAFLSVIRTAAALAEGLEQVLKPEGLSFAQYNVLRILRGSEPHGLCRNEVRDRMLTRMPDMTRLLDRMESTGLVARTRSESDRRIVTTHVTEHGLQVLDRLQGAVEEEHRRRFAPLGRSKTQMLVELLETVRQA